MRGIHRWPGNSPHKGPVTRKMFPFDRWRHHKSRYKGCADIVPCCVLPLKVAPISGHLTLTALLHFISPWQNGCHFADDIFICIFVIDFIALIKTLLRFVPEGLIDNNPAFVQIRVWRWIGDKPLSEPMLTRFTDAYMQHQGDMS